MVVVSGDRVEGVCDWSQMARGDRGRESDGDVGINSTWASIYTPAISFHSHFSKHISRVYRRWCRKGVCISNHSDVLTDSDVLTEDFHKFQKLAPAAVIDFPT